MCLANGDKNYVPPQSALDFSKNGMNVMRIMYGEKNEVITSDGFSEWVANNPSVEVSSIVPWGWDSRLKNQLEKQNVPQTLLPNDEKLHNMRRLQHRTTILPLQQHAWMVTKEDELIELLDRYHSIVMKAPWSGAGRGLRWVTDTLSNTDLAWFAKTVASQQCVVVEVRQSVKHNFAIEYYISNHQVELTGLSLFETQSGVYRHNVLLYDDEIKEMVNFSTASECSLRNWLKLFVAPLYDGPLGIDLICNNEGELFVCEMNLRHTMGMVAHSYLQQHPESHGSLWSCVI